MHGGRITAVTGIITCNRILNKYGLFGVTRTWKGGGAASMRAHVFVIIHFLSKEDGTKYEFEYSTINKFKY